MYPAYKMFSQADLLKQEKKTSTARTLKKIAINSRISSNDLVVKIDIVKKWLSKRDCEVHVAILKNDGVESTMVIFGIYLFLFILFYLYKKKTLKIKYIYIISIKF